MRQHAQFAGFDLLQHGGRAGGHGVNLTPQQRQHGGAGTREGNVGEFHPRCLGQDFHGHMHRAVVAR